MTAPMITTAGSVTDRHVARGATGLLRQFNQAGVLGPADIHTAVRVMAICAQSDPLVELALAMTVRALRTGSVLRQPGLGGPDRLRRGHARRWRGGRVGCADRPQHAALARAGGLAGGLHREPDDHPRRRCARRLAAADGQRAALSRAVLGPGGAGPRRAGRTTGRAVTRRRSRSARRRADPDLRSAFRGRAGSSAPGRGHQRDQPSDRAGGRPRHRQDHDGGQAVGLGRRGSTPAPGWPWRRRPGRRPPGWRRRSVARPATCPPSMR